MMHDMITIPRSCLSLSSRALAPLAALATLGFTNVAGADDTRLGAYGIINLSGEMEGELQGGDGDPDDQQDMDYSVGAGLSYDTAIVRILALGALFRFYSWSADDFSWETDGDNEGLGFDIDFLPRLRFPARKLEVYFSLPMGLTVASKDDNAVLAVFETEYDIGVGYNYGLFGGVQFPLDREMALFGEFGYQVRNVTFDAEGRFAGEGDPIDRELHTEVGQFAINLGAAFF
jgi:hypothetical protein